MYQDDENLESEYVYEDDEEGAETPYASNYGDDDDDDDAEDVYADDSVWDTRTQKFTTRSEVWCAFEDEDE
jgi:hypothetical protein